jgi:hypothetical protein
MERMRSGLGEQEVDVVTTDVSLALVSSMADRAPWRLNEWATLREQQTTTAGLR